LKIRGGLFDTFIYGFLGFFGCEKHGTENDVGKNRGNDNECDKNNCCLETGKCIIEISNAEHVATRNTTLFIRRGKLMIISEKINFPQGNPNNSLNLKI